MIPDQPAGERTETDFPAAHSMDSCWFAVDQDGHVGFFDTGESGLVPESAFGVSWGMEGGEAMLRPLLEWLLRRRAPPSDDEVLPWLDAEEAARLGLFVYEGEGDLLPGPYRRTHRPQLPVHIDQLPPKWQKYLKEMRFAAVCFAKQRRLWPADHGECSGWDPAYLCSDGKTVRPLPGREGDYAEFIAEYADDLDDGSGRLRIEGLDERPAEEE